MAGAPLRFTEDPEDRFEKANSELQALEQKLLDASARRIHDFERRLEHEWLALRQLHEEPLKTLEQKTTSITETCLAVVREALVLLQSQLGKPHTADRRPRAMTSGLVAALAVLAAFTAYTRWSVGSELRDLSARAASAEQRVAELQQTLERQARTNEETVQRLTSDTIAVTARAQRLANVLGAPDLRVFPLRGLPAAAAATGRALYSPSRGVTVNISKLPAPAPNQTYQVWLVTTAGSIGLGLVAPDSQGRVDAAFDAPAESAGTATGLMLSLEPVGGSAKPSSRIALAS